MSTSQRIRQGKRPATVQSAVFHASIVIKHQIIQNSKEQPNIAQNIYTNLDFIKYAIRSSTKGSTIKVFIPFSDWLQHPSENKKTDATTRDITMNIPQERSMRAAALTIMND